MVAVWEEGVGRVGRGRAGKCGHGLITIHRPFYAVEHPVGDVVGRSCQYYYSSGRSILFPRIEGIIDRRVKVQMR